MKYVLMPKALWAAFSKSFKMAMTEVMPQENAKAVMKSAHREYKQILSGVDEFDKANLMGRI